MVMTENLVFMYVYLLHGLYQMANELVCAYMWYMYMLTYMYMLKGCWKSMKCVCCVLVYCVLLYIITHFTSVGFIVASNRLCTIWMHL